MKSLDDIKPRSNDVKWRDNILKPDMPKKDEWYSFRILGGILCYAQHWVKSTNKTGKEVVFPVDCLAWDSDNEEVDQKKVHLCPGCQAGIKPSSKYLVNVIDRGIQKKSGGDFIRAFDFPPTAMKKIMGLKSLNLVNGTPISAAHPEYGFDLFIRWASQGGKNGSGDWEVQKGERTQLTDAEKSAELYDFEDIYVPGDAANARQSLVRAGYFKDEAQSAGTSMPASGAQMPPSGAMMPPANNNPVLTQHMPQQAQMPQTSQFVAPQTTLPQIQHTVTGGLGKPPETMSATERPECFGGFLGNLQCVKCPHKPACLVASQEKG